jgi:hypothetical protein
MELRSLTPVLDGLDVESVGPRHPGALIGTVPIFV